MESVMEIEDKKRGKEEERKEKRKRKRGKREGEEKKERAGHGAVKYLYHDPAYL